MICCGHILSNPYKEEVLPDPERLAMNRHQRAEDMDKVGNHEKYVFNRYLYYRDSRELRRREREFVYVCTCDAVKGYHPRRESRRCIDEKWSNSSTQRIQEWTFSLIAWKGFDLKYYYPRQVHGIFYSTQALVSC